VERSIDVTPDASGPSEQKEVQFSLSGRSHQQGIPVHPPAVTRLVSLDAFRGFIMFWIVGGGGLMLGCQSLGHNRLIDFLAYQLDHTPWEGLRFYDCIWPSFMLMVGMSVPFSYAKRSLTQTPQEMMRHAVKRAAVLFLLGSLRESVNLGSPYWIELSSALQPIAVAYLVAFWLARKSWKIQAITGGAILAGYALLLALVAAPGIPAGSYVLNANLVTYVDIAILGRTHPEGWGTVVSTIPTVATTILGLLVGELLRSNRTPNSKAKIIGVIGVAGLLLGYTLSQFVPVVMKMWTTSYGILTAAWASLMFLMFYWVIDVLGHRNWAFPLGVIGMNALAIYLADTVTRLPQVIHILAAGVAKAAGSFGPLSEAVCLILTEWLILYWMYRRKLFLTA
jgi:predicted acyltransferase